MKKMIFLILCLFSAKVLMATDTGKIFKVKLKGAAEAVEYLVLDVNNDSMTVIKEGGNIKIPLADIESYEIKDSNSTPISFKKIVFMTDNNYIEGYIIYQDRKKISVQIDKDITSLEIKQIRDIISADDFYREKGKSARGAAWRSALYPGLGQLYTHDRQWFGIAYMTLFTVSLPSGIFFYMTGQDYYDRYKKSKYKETQYYKSYYRYTGLAIFCFVTAFTIYVWNIADAYLFFRYKFNVLNIQTEKKSGFLDCNRMELAMSKRF